MRLIVANHKYSYTFMHKCLFKSNNKSNPLKWSKDFIFFNLKTKLQYLRHMRYKFGPESFGPMCSSSRIFATFKNCINRGSHLTWMSFNAAFKCDHYRAFNYQMDLALLKFVKSVFNHLN